MEISPAFSSTSAGCPKVSASKQKPLQVVAAGSSSAPIDTPYTLYVTDTVFNVGGHPWHGKALETSHPCPRYPDFLPRLVALSNCMRLSLTKAAHAVLSGAA